jgi:ribonuclease HI
MEKLCPCLFFTCTKLRHILLSAEVIIICKSDVIKHMLSAPVLKGRLGKWMFALSEFYIRYQPAKAVKGQALADLIAERVNTNIAALSVRAWAMYFDGSVCGDGCGIGILLVSPRGATYSFSIRLPATCTNNLAEYEAVHKGMELLLEAGAEAVEVFGDSKLVISQFTEEYRCESELLFPLWVQCQELMSQFRYINFYWIPRAWNAEADWGNGYLHYQSSMMGRSPSSSPSSAISTWREASSSELVSTNSVDTSATAANGLPSWKGRGSRWATRRASASSRSESFTPSNVQSAPRVWR